MKTKKLFSVQQAKREEAGITCGYVDSPLLCTPIPKSFTMPGFQISTDSGAHTLYKMFFVQGSATEYARQNADYSYLQTKEFKQFLDAYIQNILMHKDDYTFYVTLDIINNPEESWKITKYIESYGLKPVPVFHNGEDIYWLKKMLDEYDYIGISGLGQDITKTKFKAFGDACFKEICDRHGVPQAKIHGFAMGTPEILAQYPWYSADQSTWTYMSRVGSLLVPKPIIKNKEIKGFDYLSRYLVLPVTNRRRFENRHLENYQHGERLDWLKFFIEQEGFTLEEAQEFYHIRDTLNIRLFHNIQTSIKKLYYRRYGYERGGNILFAGTPSGAGSNIGRFCRLMYEIQLAGMHWLGTPVYQKHLSNCIKFHRSAKKQEDFRVHWNPQTVALQTNPTAKVRMKRKPLFTPGKKIDYQVTLQVTVTLKADNQQVASELAVNSLKDSGITATVLSTIAVPTSVPALQTSQQSSSFEDAL